ncbi:hypothetical protein [Azoarcus sp. KH32C]|uniref:hypothetical protein n=1 Tax=Azoarcus sp. KH32C TaxID=748247 RepID=UPI000238605D|nr:hypothetical protein [Azoarcus sp. KH32C]BAL25648.1 hypothetical protein AZKH_3359 [Azoarcus sp. KH32C]
MRSPSGPCGRWRAKSSSPLRIVAGDRWTVAGLIAYSQRGLIPYFSWDSKRNPWLHADEVEKDGAVFVHRLKDDTYDTALIRDLKARYPTLAHEQTVALPPLSTASLAPIRFWIAYLPPQG